MPSHSRLFGATLVAAASLVVSSSRADEAADIAAARVHGQDGVMLADQGKCAAAIEKLDRAEKLHHAPTTALRLAECEIEVGHIVSGTERLQRLVHEPLPPNAPPAFHAAVTKAETVLAANQPKIAMLRIQVQAPLGTELVVTYDEEAVPNSVLGHERPSDPGTHKITAKAKGFLPASSNVTLRDGESGTVSLTLQVDPNAPKDPVPTTEPEVQSKPSRVPAIIAFGVGAVGLGFGIVGGAITASNASTLESNCTNNACPPTQRDTLDDAKTWSTISTVGFIVAGVGAAAGVTLLLLGNGKQATAHGGRPRIGVTNGNFSASF